MGVFLLAGGGPLVVVGWGGADNPLTTTLTSGHYRVGAPHDQGGYTAIRGLV